MNASELKFQVENHYGDQYFFSRQTMRFFGDTMRNFGVRSCTVRTNYDARGAYVPGEGVTVECWELYRKRPVKHGLRSSAFFAKSDFHRVHASDDEIVRPV